MNKKYLICSLFPLALAALITGCASERHESHESQAQLQAQAKVSKAEAEKVALAQAPGGTIKEGELEREGGKLIWSFDITIPGSKDIKEVNVDAITGKIISVETETPSQQAKEKEKDSKEKNDKD